MTNFQSKHVALLKNKKDCADVYCVTLIVLKKKVLNGNFYTTRPVGRPKTRRTDVVQRNALRLLGIRGWRRRGENTDECRRLMRKAKARKGLQRRIWMDKNTGVGLKSGNLHIKQRSIREQWTEKHFYDFSKLKSVHFNILIHLPASYTVLYFMTCQQNISCPHVQQNEQWLL